MSLPLNKLVQEEGNFTSERNNCKGGERCGDLLEEELLRRSKAAKNVVIKAYLLVASVLGEEKWTEGYRQVYSQLKGTHKILYNRIKIEQAVKHIKTKYFDSAIELLKISKKK